MSVVKPDFVQIINGILGAEGPVFDNRGNFYMVAPEVEKDGKAAGEILRVDVHGDKPVRVRMARAKVTVDLYLPF